MKKSTAVKRSMWSVTRAAWMISLIAVVLFYDMNTSFSPKTETKKKKCEELHVLPPESLKFNIYGR